MSARARASIKVADEVWIATALLHRENPRRPDFTVAEIIERARKAGLTPTPRPGVYVHAVQHCVANRPPNPGRYRMLLETGENRRRLYWPGDPCDPAREGAKMVRPERKSRPRTTSCSTGTTRTTPGSGPRPSGRILSSRYAVLAKPSGRMRMRMTTSDGSGQGGSEPDLLGHEPLHLPLRGSRSTLAARRCPSGAHARAERPALHLNPHAGRGGREASRTRR